MLKNLNLTNSSPHNNPIAILLNTLIPIQETIKYVGMHIDNKILWKTQIHYYFYLDIMSETLSVLFRSNLQINQDSKQSTENHNQIPMEKQVHLTNKKIKYIIIVH